jgi:hypothetical protein
MIILRAYDVSQLVHASANAFHYTISLFPVTYSKDCSACIIFVLI